MKSCVTPRSPFQLGRCRLSKHTLLAGARVHEGSQKKPGSGDVQAGTAGGTSSRIAVNV